MAAIKEWRVILLKSLMSSHGQAWSSNKQIINKNDVYKALVLAS